MNQDVYCGKQSGLLLQDFRSFKCVFAFASHQSMTTRWSPAVRDHREILGDQPSSCWPPAAAGLVSKNLPMIPNKDPYDPCITPETASPVS